MDKDETTLKDNESSLKTNHNRLYVWGTIENIVTILAITGLFLWTGSVWSFLLLLNINTVKEVFKKQI